MARPREDLAARFWAKVDKRGPDECWPWTGGKRRKGYGAIGEGGRGGKMLVASRLAYELQNGPIPEGHQVLHSCDNPPCCNGAHLFTGTNLDNIGDMREKGRQRYVGGPRKLTEEQRQAIRLDTRPQDDIARDFGVDQSTISRIKREVSLQSLHGPLT